MSSNLWRSSLLLTCDVRLLAMSGIVSEDTLLCCGHGSEVGTISVFGVIGSVAVDDAAGVDFSKADLGVAEGIDDSEGLGTGGGVICVVVSEVGIE